MGSDDEMMLNLLMGEEANAKVGEEEHFMILAALEQLQAEKNDVRGDSWL
jgi:hypothetical protein